MTTAPPLLVSLDGRFGDSAAVAAALAPALGAHPTDVAGALARSPGFLAVALELDAADQIAKRLRAAGQRVYAIASTLAPRPPKPLVAQRLDPRPDDALLAQVALAGPPLRVAPQQVLAALPVRWASGRSTAAAAPVAQGPSAMKMAMSVATTGGVGLLFGGRGGKADDRASAAAAAGPSEVRTLLAIVALTGPGQWLRLHVFADRCDYSVLAAPSADAERNWRALLAALQARLRPQQAAAEALAQALLPRPASPVEALALLPRLFDDDNALADHLRWLLLAAALRRLGAS